MAEFLSFLKPDAVIRKNIGISIIKEFARQKDITISSFQLLTVSRNLAESHYAHVKTQPFFNWLISYITIMPVYCFIIVGEDETISNLRDLLGATKSHLAKEGSIRNRFGIYAGINCVHLSDSIQSGADEIALWKQMSNLKSGKFDLELNDYISSYNLNLHDNTQELRKLCQEITERNAHNDKMKDKILTLLREENPIIETNKLMGFISTIVESCYF